MKKTLDILTVAAIAVALLAVTLEAGTTTTLGEFPKIDRRPEPENWGRGKKTSIPKYDPNSTNPFQVDLRCYDLSELDLTNSLDDLLYSSFDDRTTWPASDRMPEGFDWKKSMEIGKNPGLGIRELHKKGIKGRGIGIAILDQPLLVDHQEYVKQLRLYEEINIENETPSRMHGPAVVSIAVGRTVGVAPEADLYYIAEWNGDSDKGKFTWNFTYLAQGVHRILEINEQLPKDKKIRVISMSVGWGPSQKGYQKITEAVQKAKEAGMLVICSSVERVHGFKFHGLDREPLSNPDDFNSYEPGSWWAKRFYSGGHFSDHLLVPMDSRTTASPTGADEYVFYRHGGWSWSIPYIAGVYALAAQVDVNITPDRFWALAMKTGRTIELQYKGEKIPFGPILNPAKLIDAISSGELSDNAAVAQELAKYNYDISNKSAVRDSGFLKDINTKVAQLDINKALHEDVVKVFGQPLSYLWGSQTFEKDNLPNRYIMSYPDDFRVVIVNDYIEELRFHSPGYVFRDGIRVGSSLDDALKVIGAPREIIEGKKNEFKDYVLYKNIDGREGNHYYSRRDHGVRMFFMNNKVTALFMTRTEPIAQRN